MNGVNVILCVYNQQISLHGMYSIFTFLQIYSVVSRISASIMKDCRFVSGNAFIRNY
jgi:hypothetical protein